MRFREFRERAGLTQTAVGKALGVTGEAVCLWEREGDGGTTPRANLLPAIAKLYGCTVDDLLRDAPEKGA